MPTRKPIIIGNWKMFKTVGEAIELAEAIARVAAEVDDIETGIAPPFTALASVSEKVRNTPLRLAAQNCHFAQQGAFTGEVAVPMLKDVGCSHIIVGHSERRQYFGEDDALVNRKVKAVLEAGLTPVMCIGESLAEREAGNAFKLVQTQLKGGFADLTPEQAKQVVVAYEPVWAIGTGKTATTEQAQEIHAYLRGQLRELVGDAADAVRIQYGGSVKPANVSALMAEPDIDGALVGGASLKADSFGEILKYQR